MDEQVRIMFLSHGSIDCRNAATLVTEWEGRDAYRLIVGGRS